MTNRAAVLAVYLEPAPYVVRLVDELRLAWSGAVDVLYASRSLTQDWKHDLDVSGEHILPRRTFMALWEIRRRMASGQYAILHLAGWGHPILLGALVLGRAMGIPTAVESDTGGVSGTSAWKGALKLALYPRLFKMPALFLPGGTRQSRYLRGYGVAESRINIAQMTSDVAGIAAHVGALDAQARLDRLQRLGIGEKGVKFLYVGRLEPHKGIQDLLVSFVRLREQRTDVALLIVGSGSMSQIVSDAAASGNSIHWLGRLEGDNLWDAYALADVFVLPSLFEPWGLVVNEAMAAGLPVIVTEQVGCVDDLVGEGENGLIVNAGSATELANAMEVLAENVELRSRMGREGTRRIAGWTLAAEAKNVCDAWRKALAG